MIREIKDEIGLDVEVLDELGSNEYLANDKEHGKIRKQVHYFLVKSDFVPVKLQEEGGGLTDTKWFDQDEVAGIGTYNDIKSIITKGVEQAQKLEFGS